MIPSSDIAATLWRAVLPAGSTAMIVGAQLDEQGHRLDDPVGRPGGTRRSRRARKRP